MDVGDGDTVNVGAGVVEGLGRGWKVTGGLFRSSVSIRHPGCRIIGGDVLEHVPHRPVYEDAMLHFHDANASRPCPALESVPHGTAFSSISLADHRTWIVTVGVTILSPFHIGYRAIGRVIRRHSLYVIASPRLRDCHCLLCARLDTMVVRGPDRPSEPAA